MTTVNFKMKGNVVWTRRGNRNNMRKYVKVLLKGDKIWEHIVVSNRMTQILSWGDWRVAKIGKYETK